MQSELSSYFGSKVSAPCCESTGPAYRDSPAPHFTHGLAAGHAGAPFVPFTQQHQRAFIASALEFEVNSTGVAALEIISYRCGAPHCVAVPRCNPSIAAYPVPQQPNVQCCREYLWNTIRCPG